MSEGYSRVMKSASGRPAPKEDSFRELKRLIDEGYEHFWSKTHRTHLRPINPDHGVFAFGSGYEEREREKKEEDSIA